MKMGHFRISAAKFTVAATAFIFISISPLNEASMQGQIMRQQVQQAHQPKLPPAEKSHENSNNSYSVHINLPEFKSRLYEEGNLIDSAVISPGRYRRRSPVFKTEQSLIALRPSFYPTEGEKYEFPPNPPDRTKYPQKPRNALGRFKIYLYPNYKFHGTSMVSSISQFSSDGNVQKGQFRSNGCIRHGNFDGERMIAKIIRGSKIRKIAGAFKDSIGSLIGNLKSGKLEPTDFISNTPGGRTHLVYLQNQIKIIISYRVWDKKISLTDSTLNLTLYRDIYDYANSRAPPTGTPFFKDMEENAFTYEHFRRDLAENKILISDSCANEVFEKLQKEIAKNKTPGKKVQIHYDGKAWSPEAATIY